MMEEAKLIVKRCGGLPLAIATIGGLLATKPRTTVEWRKLNDHISAELEINPQLQLIRTVLTSSYRIGEVGVDLQLITERHGMTAQEVGERYFTNLIERNMIQPSETVTHSSGDIKLCQVHDLIREIVISKSREENLVLVLDAHCRLLTQDMARHLSVSSSWDGDKSEFESTADLSRLRSLTAFGEWRTFYISDKTWLLRVLDLKDTHGLRDHHLERIGKLLHLKYLSLRGCQHIYHLPDSLGDLIHLQTLDIKDTSVIELPKTIMNLQKLQYLWAGKVPNNEQDAIQVLSMLPNLTILHLWEDSFRGEELHFQETFGSLVELRIDRLQNLRSVQFEEGSMPKLEMLHIDEISCEYVIYGLSFLPSLRKISRDTKSKLKEIMVKFYVQQVALTFIDGAHNL